jgi:hypothetical protein
MPTQLTISVLVPDNANRTPAEFRVQFEKSITAAHSSDNNENGILNFNLDFGEGNSIDKTSFGVDFDTAVDGKLTVNICFNSPPSSGKLLSLQFDQDFPVVDSIECVDPNFQVGPNVLESMFEDSNTQDRFPRLTFSSSDTLHPLLLSARRMFANSQAFIQTAFGPKFTSAKVVSDEGSTSAPMLTSTEEMFAGSNIEIATFPVDDTVVSTKGMFRGCENLEAVFLNVRPTNSLEDLSEMFADCGGPFRLEFRDEVGDLSHVKTISKLFFNARISEVLNVDSQFFKRKSHRRAIKHDGVFGGDFS